MADRGGDHRPGRPADRRPAAPRSARRGRGRPRSPRAGCARPARCPLLGGRSVEAGPPSPLRPSTGRRSLVRHHLRPDGRELLGRVPGVVQAAGRAVETARLVDAPTVRAVVPGRPLARGRSVRVAVAATPVVVPVGLVAVVDVPVPVVETIAPVPVVETVVRADRAATLVVRVRGVRVGVRPGVRVGVQLRAGGGPASPTRRSPRTGRRAGREAGVAPWVHRRASAESASPPAPRVAGAILRQCPPVGSAGRPTTAGCRISAVAKQASAPPGTPARAAPRIVDTGYGPARPTTAGAVRACRSRTTSALDRCAPPTCTGTR